MSKNITIYPLSGNIKFSTSGDFIINLDIQDSSSSLLFDKNVGSSVTPSLSSDFITKGFLDGITSNFGSNGQFVSLTGDDSVSGNKSFINNITMLSSPSADNHLITLGYAQSSLSSLSALKLGTPSDGTYSDGFFNDWSVGLTPLWNALDDISEAFLDLAPAKASLLTGLSLTLAGTTTYSAILPSGLSSSWYSFGSSSGNTITTYVVDNTYTLSTPNTTSAYRNGKAYDTTTWGTTFQIANGLTTNTFNMSLTTGTSGQLQITSNAVYNTFWRKANAVLNITQSNEGGLSSNVGHSEAGITNGTLIYYDPQNTTPSFQVNPLSTTSVVALKYLSNVPYFTTGTTLSISYTSNTGIFNRAYHPTNVSIITVTGANATTVNPGSVPAFNDRLIVTNQSVSINVNNRATNNRFFTVTLYKPNGTTTSATGSLLYGINTFGTSSTTASEFFYDETYRSAMTIGATAAWNSLTSFNASNTGIDLQVRNGSLVYPVTSDYGSFTNPTGEKWYTRLFYKPSASNGTIVFGNFNNATATVTSYNTGNVNAFLYLETVAKWYDLGRPFGSNNGDGTGSTSANSIGARSSGNASTINFTFGTDTTGANNNRYRFYILFRNNSNSLSSIVTS